MVHAPVHVMLHVPALQLTVDPAPTVTVHEAPPHSTLEFAPVFPLQVAPEAQLNDEVALERSPKSQLAPEGHAHEFPEHTLGEQPASPKSDSASPKRALRSVMVRVLGERVMASRSDRGPAHERASDPCWQ